MAVLELGEAPERDVDAFQGLDAADEEDEVPVGGQPEPGPGVALVAGREAAVVDAGRDDLDPVGVGAPLDEVGPLGGGRDDEHVGAALHLVLDAVPVLGVVDDPGFGLGAGQGVEGGDERHVELVLQAVRDRARDPVVGVDGGVAGPPALQMVAGRGDEVVEEAGEGVLLDRRRRSGVEVDHPQPRLELHDAGLAGLLGAGQDVAGDPGAGQRLPERPDVDVHAAPVASSGLRQR